MFWPVFHMKKILFLPNTVAEMAETCFSQNIQNLFLQRQISRLGNPVMHYVVVYMLIYSTERDASTRTLAFLTYLGWPFNACINCLINICFITTNHMDKAVTLSVWNNMLMMLSCIVLFKTLQVVCCNVIVAVGIVHFTLLSEHIGNNSTTSSTCHHKRLWWVESTFFPFSHTIWMH